MWIWPLSYTATVFASRVSDPVSVDPDSYVLRNLSKPTTNVGLELLATLRRGPYSATATYTYVRARETIDGVEQEVSLTPRHSAGVVGMWEAEDVGRIGIEWYYTGLQSVEDNPYRSVTEPSVIVGVLAEKLFGRVRLFLNGENLTDVRQTKWDPLLRPTRAFNGRWTVDAWAPLEGRNINGGVRTFLDGPVPYHSRFGRTVHRTIGRSISNTPSSQGRTGTCEESPICSGTGRHGD